MWMKKIETLEGRANWQSKFRVNVWMLKKENGKDQWNDGSRRERQWEIINNIKLKKERKFRE
jgi:hypothetical protein